MSLECKLNCKFCNKKGLFWLPLRYSVVTPQQDIEELKTLPALKGMLGTGVVDIPLTQSKYALRLLRPGYLYVLIERSGIKYWEGYKVLEDAYLYKFNVAFPPQTDTSFCCDPTTHGIDASMVAISDAENVKRVWALFTPSLMTTAKLDEYKKDENVEKYVSEGKMQTFSPADWVKGKRNQPHALLANQIHENVAEYILSAPPYDPYRSPLGKSLANQLFPAIRAAYEHVSAPKDDLAVESLLTVNLATNITVPTQQQGTGGRLKGILDKIKNGNHAAWALHDPIGITQELNHFRNVAFTKVDEFLAQKDQYGTTNERKLIIYQKIQEVHAGIRTGVYSDAAKTARANDIIRRSKLEPHFPDDSMEMRAEKATVQVARGKNLQHHSRQEWEAQYPKIAEELNTAYVEEIKTLAKTANQEAKDKWENRYLPKLDANEMQTFAESFDAIASDANKVAESREDDHLKWATSRYLVAAFETYDKKDGACGHAFEGESALCTSGMTGLPKSAAQVEKWVNDVKVSPHNIYMRGHYMNQDDIEKAAREAMPIIMAEAEKAPSISEMDEGAIAKPLAKIVGAFKKMDSAYDEWVRNHNQMKGWGPSREAALLAKASEMTRFVFRQGITGIDKKMAGFIGAMTYSKLGKYAEQAHLEQFFLKIYGPRPPTQRKTTKTQTIDSKNAVHSEAQAPKSPREVTEQRILDTIEKSRNDKARQLSLKAEGEMFDAIDDARRRLKERLNLSHDEVLALHKRIDDNRAHKINEYVDLQTNNYHQVRIGILLTVLESIALWGHINKFERGGRAYLEMTGLSLSLASAAFDTVYAGIKVTRENVVEKARRTEVRAKASGNAITLADDAVARGMDIGGEVARGQWKLAAGTCATFAGIISVFIDALNIKNEFQGRQRGLVILIYGSRIFAMGGATWFGAIAALSYAGPALTRARAQIGTRLIGAAGARKLRSATLLAYVLRRKRVLWLLQAARWNMAGLAITGLELIFYAFSYYFLDDVLQDWCERSTFRLDKKTKRFWNSDRPYIDIKNEVDGLDSAFAELK